MHRHDWIFDMLFDLQDYATANGLPDLAASVAVSLAVARRETTYVEGLADLAGPDRRSRPH
jgi:hypothetical protein